MGSITKQATFRLSPEAFQILENIPRGSRGHFISRLILSHYKEHPDFFFSTEEPKVEPTPTNKKSTSLPYRLPNQEDSK